MFKRLFVGTVSPLKTFVHKVNSTDSLSFTVEGIYDRNSTLLKIHKIRLNGITLWGGFLCCTYAVFSRNTVNSTRHYSTEEKFTPQHSFTHFIRLGWRPGVTQSTDKVASCNKQGQTKAHVTLTTVHCSTQTLRKHRARYSRL